MATQIKDTPEEAKRTVADDEPTSQPRALLEGLRVVEGSAFVAAPLGGMTLAQLGADVIRFDPIGGGIDHHRWPLTKDGASLFWAGLNKGKRSIAINLAHPEGTELATHLITADGADRGIFLTNFPAQGWLDYARLRSLRDDLVMLSVTGDHLGRSEVDYTVNAAMGFPMVTGPKDTELPVNHVLPTWDAITGLWAACGILAAERYRRATGKGQLVSLALTDVALAITSALGILDEVMINGEDRPRHGNDLFGSFGRDFETADGRRIMVVGLTARQWKGLLAATGLEAEIMALGENLALDFSDQGNRFIARDGIAAHLAPWISARSLIQCAEAFDANGVCWGPYQTFRELVENDPRCSTANPLFDMVDQPGIGALLMAGSPLTGGALEREAPRPAPRLGSDTDVVLSEVLGLSQGEIGKLHDSGIVAGPEKHR